MTLLITFTVSEKPEIVAVTRNRYLADHHVRASLPVEEWKNATTLSAGECDESVIDAAIEWCHAEMAPGLAEELCFA